MSCSYGRDELYAHRALSPLLQDLRHYPDATIGYLMSARGLGDFLSFGVVVWATRYNARLALASGLLLQAWAVWQMTRFNINVSDFDIYWTTWYGDSASALHTRR